MSSDVTDSCLAEQRRNLLVGEIAHRGKNLLAVVQAIAAMTLTDSKPINESRQSFIHRLDALSRSHSMLTQCDWEGVPMDEIVRLEVARHSDQVAYEFPSVLLNPSAAQNISLVIHELTTNAAKYGALTTPAGRIIAKGVRSGEFIRFTWEEQGGPEICAPRKNGFGSILLRRLIQGFDTEGFIDYRPTGLFIQVDMPLDMLMPTNVGVPQMHGRQSS